MENKSTLQKPKGQHVAKWKEGLTEEEKQSNFENLRAISKHKFVQTLANLIHEIDPLGTKSSTSISVFLLKHKLEDVKFSYNVLTANGEKQFNMQFSATGKLSAIDTELSSGDVTSIDLSNELQLEQAENVVPTKFVLQENLDNCSSLFDFVTTKFSGLDTEKELSVFAADLLLISNQMLNIKAGQSLSTLTDIHDENNHWYGEYQLYIENQDVKPTTALKF